MTDRFGNALDPSVGFARGRFLLSSADDIRRLRNAQAVTAQFVVDRGLERIGVFTGNPRYFPLKPADLGMYCEEWVGPGLFAAELSEVAIDHFGGGDTVAVVNRTSAGIIAAILALSGGRPVVSVVPTGDRSHASAVRGCKLADVELIEIEGDAEAPPVIEQHNPALVLITTVTSTLARLDDAVTQAAIAAGKAADATVFLDEAYGARLRPVLHGGAKSLTMGADLAVTNADKAGLSGPRAGVLCGASAPVLATLAKASELGQEARAPIAAGAMRSLQKFDPQDILDEARDGQSIADALGVLFGADVIMRSDLGPMVAEEDILSLMMTTGKGDMAPIVPAEATAALGMVLLRDHGVLTVNSHGAPGGRVSMRLKPTAGALNAVGGVDALVDAMRQGMEMVSAQMHDDDWMQKTLFGT